MISSLVVPSGLQMAVLGEQFFINTELLYQQASISILQLFCVTVRK